MMPYPVPTTILREETHLRKILIAVDDAGHSARALHYVGALLRHAPDAEITLFHVLKPMPRELLEHGGSEDPAEEARLARELQQEQEKWVRSETMAEYPILVNAMELLEKTGFPLDRVTLRFGHEDDIALTILDEARTGCYGTIVVSRRSLNGMKRFFTGGVIDQLVRDASGYTLWVVE